MHPRLSGDTRLEHWKRNLLVICLAQMITLIGFAIYQPFIPFYIQELGATSYQEAINWQALFETGSAVAMMIAAPIWGTLADRHGRKMMLVRATLAGAVMALLMSLAQSPMHLVIIRTVQGAFTGTVSAAMTLVATETPEENLGMALGLMQTVQLSGHAAGPVIGGVLADTYGYRAVFPISSAMMGVALVIIALLVRERFTAPARPTTTTVKKVRNEALRQVLTRNIIMMVVTLGAIRFTVAVVEPIMSLYVQSLALDHPRLATLAGTVVSVSGLTTAVAALGIGRMADRIGQKKVLVACILGVAALQVPQAYVTSAGQLIVVRALQGLFMGGAAPTANALAARTTPAERRGTMFGISTSVQAGGRALGPMVGAGIANGFGMSSVFVITGASFALIGGLVGALVRLKPETRPAVSLAGAAPEEVGGSISPRPG
jgi:MFS transporter, DHA1 family, multidrug resistance protein